MTKAVTVVTALSGSLEALRMTFTGQPLQKS
jgi:hypothetical protein